MKRDYLCIFYNSDDTIQINSLFSSFTFALFYFVCFHFVPLLIYCIEKSAMK